MTKLCMGDAHLPDDAGRCPLCMDGIPFDFVAEISSAAGSFSTPMTPNEFSNWLEHDQETSDFTRLGGSDEGR
jgi:hypothetical protein